MKENPRDTLGENNIEITKMRNDLFSIAVLDFSLLLPYSYRSSNFYL